MTRSRRSVRTFKSSRQSEKELTLSHQPFVFLVATSTVAERSRRISPPASRSFTKSWPEEEDTANFNPKVDARDYDEVARSLPVFCVSSRAYQKLMNRLQKGKAVPGFKDVDETES
jgi:hypothetical protein